MYYLLTLTFTSCPAAFYGLDAGVLIRALKVLEGRGRAVLYPSENGLDDETGVKFFGKENNR